MLLVRFNRPAQSIQCFDANGQLAKTFRGEGDAWGAPGYGHDGWTPPGHYVLGAVEFFNPPIASEGFGQIPVLDIDPDTRYELIAAKKATLLPDGQLVIGGVTAWSGQLAAYDRDGIMNHCGGSNASDPFADKQQLCKTYGCTRMWNVEWREFAAWLNANREGNTVIYTVVGDPISLPC
jgi:hypothetical protein